MSALMKTPNTAIILFQQTFVLHTNLYLYLLKTLLTLSVNGGYGEWKKWGHCDVECGNGKRKRIRHCDSPSPENGGLNCDTEEGSQVEGCSMKPCTTGRLPL